MTACMNCGSRFTDDSALVRIEDVDGGHFKGCPVCHTDEYLVETKGGEAYEQSSFC